MSKPALFGLLPAFWKETMMLWGFSAFKIPMLFSTRPNVMALDKEKAVVRIKLRRRTKNHVGTMYLAAMVAGADLASALMAMSQVRDAGEEVIPIFSEVSAQFFKRAEGDVLFTCTEGELVADMVREVLETRQRVTRNIPIVCTVPDKLGDEPVAEIVMGLSLKLKKRSQ